MNNILRGRLTQTLVWVAITITFSLLHGNYLSGDVAWALLLAAAVTAVVNALMLLILGNEPLQLSERLTVLGGLLASMYGHDK